MYESLKCENLNNQTLKFELKQGKKMRRVIDSNYFFFFMGGGG